MVEVSNSSSIRTINISLKQKTAARVAPGTIDARAYANIPKEAQKLYNQAMKATESGHIDESIAKLKDATKICPTYGFAYIELAVNHLRLNQADAAIEALKPALDLLPDNYAVHLNYGIALVLKEQFEMSLRELRYAVDKEKTAAFPRLYLGRAFIGLNRYAEAETELQNALRLSDNGMSEAHRFLGFIYTRQRNYPQAIAELETYVKLNPKVADAAQISGIIARLREKMQVP